MTKINDGGPAFPSDRADREGMSLRDWFATQASEQDIEEHTLGDLRASGRSYNHRSREQAKYAYADAMIKARSANE